VSVVSVYLEATSIPKEKSRGITLRFRMEDGQMLESNRFAHLRTLFAYLKLSPI
jgi:hypothetical protein